VGRFAVVWRRHPVVADGVLALVVLLADLIGTGRNGAGKTTVQENVVGLLAGLVPALRVVRYLLPGPSGGALAVALWASGSTPGVAVAPAWAAVTVLVGWAVLGVWGSVRCCDGATSPRNRPTYTRGVGTSG